MRFISSFDSTDNIYHLIMYSIRYQKGFSVLYLAANDGNTDVAKMLIDGGADVNLRDKVSNMRRWIVVVIACVSDCVMSQCESVYCFVYKSPPAPALI